jgi:hypothetical protein
MIKNIKLAVITCLLLCGPTSRLFAMAMDIGIDTNGNILERSQDWPAGLFELVNSAPVFHGHWVNVNSEFFFMGNTASLTRFVKRYATLKNTPLVLVVHAGSVRPNGLWGDRPSERYDWKLSVLMRGRGAPWKPINLEDLDNLEKLKDQWVVTVDVWIDNNITLKDLTVPKEVKVTSAGEIETFISKHNDAQQPDGAVTQESAPSAAP